MNCPACDAVVYSRRSEKCGVCGEALPSEFLFTEEQRAIIESEIESMERSHHEFEAKMDAISDHDRFA
ncbi:MAG: hypothetical protein MUF31_00840 [Akkermansiaceae bacterium]|jgi:hypothetical protein|nr:hypothetical protein [Akkermansiaceae bacterium]